APGAQGPPGVDRDAPRRARLGERDRLPGDLGPAVAPLGHQPRVHRPEPVVLEEGRHRPPGLPPLRPRSGRGALREGPRDGARRAPGSRRIQYAELREDERLQGGARLRADRPRPAPEGGLDVREEARVEDGRPRGAARARRSGALRPRDGEGAVNAPAVWPALDLPVKPPLEPMLAKLVKALPEGEDWQLEPKWDGFRALCFRDGET